MSIGLAATLQAPTYSEMIAFFNIKGYDTSDKEFLAYITDLCLRIFGLEASYLLEKGKGKKRGR